MLRLKNLTKSYDDKVIFQDFSMEIEKNRILCPNSYRRMNIRSPTISIFRKCSLNMPKESIRLL
jgi:ABC-type lipopolysaccharide export system ATPase subunit